ncbi:MAG TPA: hypothetical protein VKR58_10715 [Aquella sp.]|nr:hypothetical protein [Aquella sp.]
MDPDIIFLVNQLRDLDPEHPKLYDLLIKKECTIEDLYTIQEFISSANAEIESILTDVFTELITIIPIETFTLEIQSILGSTYAESISKKDIRVRNCLRGVSKFLSNPEGDYDGNLSADLIMLIPHISDSRVQNFCLLILDKINTLIDIDYND